MRLALFFSLIPALAFGQASLSVTVQGQSAVTFNATQCGVTTQVKWTAAVTGISCSDLTVWGSTSACSAGPDAGFPVGSAPQSSWRTQGSGTFPLAVQDLPIFDGGTCGAATDETVNLCAQYTYASFDCSFGQTNVTANPTATLRYDAEPPGSPTISAVKPG